MSYQDRQEVTSKEYLDRALTIHAEAKQSGTKSTQIMQLKTFPKAVVQTRGRSEPIAVQAHHQVHSTLLAKTALH